MTDADVGMVPIPPEPEEPDTEPDEPVIEDDYPEDDPEESEP